MRFLVTTYIPERQGLIGRIPEKYIVDEVEAIDPETLLETLSIPLGGKAFVVPREHVIIVTPKVVNEIKDQDGRQEG